MIHRLALLKLRRREARGEIARAALDQLGAAEGVRSVRAGTPADVGSEVWDVLIEITFADPAPAVAFPDSPAWQAFVARWAAEIEVQKGWSFRLI